MNLLDKVAREGVRKLPDFRAGDSVRVHTKVREGDKPDSGKERIQIFEGTVIARRGTPGEGTFTVRKVSYGIGVERIFPYNAPLVAKVEVVTRGKVRRSKLYYLRNLSGKKARIEEGEAYSNEGPTAPSAA